MEIDIILSNNINNNQNKMSSDSESNEENVWILNVFGTEYKTGTVLIGTEVGRTAKEVIEKWKKAKNEELEKRIFRGYIYDIDDNCNCQYEWSWL